MFFYQDHEKDVQPLSHSFRYQATDVYKTSPFKPVSQESVVIKATVWLAFNLFQIVFSVCVILSHCTLDSMKSIVSY